jgi:pyruvate/2-oxoglutarate dehydrogenase complex dihydrolipoamide dehydrogenase (E3) component
MTRRFDAIIIGGGQAGPPLAGRLTAAGMTVALVERKFLGGTCVNTGCIPTKAMVASAYAAHMARRAAEYGVVIDGPIRVDMKRVKERAGAISLVSRSGLDSWLGGMKGCTLVRGQARFESARAVRVGGEVLEAERVFVNVGARAAVPDLPGLGEVEFLTNSSILELDSAPRHLLVVGGSYVGLEFAQMFRRFGSEVTVVEKGERLIAREDPDVSAEVARILEGEGIRVRVGAECMRLARRGADVALGLECASGEPEMVGSHVLVAAGRQPNTGDLGLDRAGVAVDDRGYIEVDDQLRTSAPGVWALGECNGKGAFTHTSYNDFEIVAANLLDGESRRVTDRVPAYALYIDPPLGRAGMTVSEARRSGRRVLVGERPMTRVGRAVEKGESLGFLRVVVDADSREILGAAILGTGGDEAIHCIVDVMSARAPYTALERAMHIHPTVSELIPTVLGELRPVV